MATARFVRKSVRGVVRSGQAGKRFFCAVAGRIGTELWDFPITRRRMAGRWCCSGNPMAAVFTHSDALIELAHALGGGWRVFAMAGKIPKPLRDAVYRWVARNRFRFMGKSDDLRDAGPGTAQTAAKLSDCNPALKCRKRRASSPPAHGRTLIPSSPRFPRFHSP